MIQIFELMRLSIIKIKSPKCPGEKIKGIIQLIGSSSSLIGIFTMIYGLCYHMFIADNYFTVIINTQITPSNNLGVKIMMLGLGIVIVFGYGSIVILSFLNSRQ